MAEESKKAQEVLRTTKNPPMRVKVHLTQTKARKAKETAILANLVKATEKVEMAKATKPMAKVLEKEKQPMVKQPTEKKAEMEKARTNPTTRPRLTIPPIPIQPTKVLVEKTLTPCSAN